MRDFFLLCPNSFSTSSVHPFSLILCSSCLTSSTELHIPWGQRNHLFYLLYPPPPTMVLISELCFQVSNQFLFIVWLSVDARARKELWEVVWLHLLSGRAIFRLSQVVWLNCMWFPQPVITNNSDLQSFLPCRPPKNFSENYPLTYFLIWHLI